MTQIKWVSIKHTKPPCSRDPDALGIEVLIWPRNVVHTDYSDNGTAFYGRRATGKPAFYKYGAVIDGITHWAYLPDGPE